MNEITKALFHIALGSEWVLRGETYADLEWLDTNKPKPTEQEVNDAIANLAVIETEKEQAKIDAKASALAKLAALGLTEDEVKALVS